MITWTVGRGGLLGSAVARVSGSSYDPGPIAWQDPEEARRTLHEHARAFEAAVGDSPWSVVWAAGAATTSTPEVEALRELEPLQGLLDGLRSARPSGPGVVVVTSSAGGVYAGSVHPPFNEGTPTAPLSPYGQLKLAQESLAADRLGGLCKVVIARVSNLYGPGQNLTKLQGLISRLALAAVTRQPLNVFVPLDTIRDYIYVDDAARSIMESVQRHLAKPSEGTTTEIIASGNPATVGQVISTMNSVSKRRVPVALGVHPSAFAQAADLRLVPTHPLVAATSLPVGMKSVYLDILERVQQQTLAG